jgi:uncharacterized protein (TIGR02391 family)
MTKRYIEPTFVTRQMDLRQIDQAIQKLKRRIDDVKSLSVNLVDYREQEKDNVESNVITTICEIFGESSREAQEHKHFSIWHGGINLGDSADRRQQKFLAGIPEAIKLLNGLIGRLEEKKLDLSEAPESLFNTVLDGMSLHPKIFAAAESLYKTAHYREAVFEASKTMIAMVKEKSGMNIDGEKLMKHVFSVNNPILSFNSIADETEKDEQRGMMDLYSGCVTAVRNTRGHAFPKDSPQRALEYLCFISLLANRLEETFLTKK